MTIEVPPLGSFELNQNEVDAFFRDDFVAFLEKCALALNPGQRFKRNWHHLAIGYQLMEVMQGRCRRLNINLPPRNLKSISVSVAFPAFVLGHDPTKKIVCASYSQELANKLSRDCRTIMQTDWYKRIFPNTQLSEQRNTEADFMTTARGGRMATSVGGTLTGLGADLIIFDDVLKVQDAASIKARKSLIAWYQGTAVTRLDDKKTGAIINVAQRLDADDLSGYLIEAGGWTTLSMPAIATRNESIPLLGGGTHDRKVGEVLHAEHEPQDVLDQARAELGSRGFDAQYQQNPLPLDSDIIKLSWFKTYGASDFSGGAACEVVQSWDTASADKITSDWSVCTTWHVVAEKYYLVDVFRARLRYPELKRKVVELARRFNCECILIENKGSGQSLIQDIAETGPVYPIAIDPVGDKVERLSMCTAAIESGRVYLPQFVPWLDEFKSEILRFPSAHHDDQVDSLSQFLGYMRQRRMQTILRFTF